MALLPTDLTELTAHILGLRKRGGVGGVPEVVFFGAGLHREGEPPYSRADIADILRNFQALSTGPDPKLPIRIGLDHVPGGPRVGDVVRLWEKPGGVLAGQFADMPALYAEAVRHRLWFTVSAEVERAPPFGLPGSGCCLVGVTLLGANREQLKWTDKLSAASVRTYAAGRSLRFWTERHGTRTSVYSEAVMDRKQLEDKLKQIGWSDAMVKAVSDGIADDAAFSTFVTEALAEKAAPADTGDGTTPPMDKTTMIDAILAADPVQDRAALEAMTPEALKALYDQKTAGTYAEEEDDEEDEETPAKPPVKPAAKPSPSAEQVASYAERAVNLALKKILPRVMAPLVKQQERAVAQTQAIQAAQRKEYAERSSQDRRATIDAFVVTERDAGRISAWELDESDRKTAHLSLRNRLYRMSAEPTVCYAENGQMVKKSQLEIEMDAIRARPVRRHYGEVLGGAAPDPQTAVRQEVKAWYAQQYPKSVANGKN